MKTMISLVAAGLAAGTALGGITSAPFGKTADGKAVTVYTLTNSKGMEARIINYGGIVLSLKVPDKAGKLDDVVLGYDNLAGYEKVTPYFGALIGRYGNRIGKGQFTLDGVAYNLSTNDGPNHLHGGFKGFDKVVWSAKAKETKDGPVLELDYVSRGGEEGYPGKLTVKALYTVTEKNELKVEFKAVTDKATICNLTHHSYFNLAGSGDILGHELTMPADRFTPIDSGLITTGELRPVAGTPFDFRKATAIGARINAKDEQLVFGKGYDHNWVFDKKPGQLTLMATVRERATGRVLEVLSDEPGLQFYSGNFLDGTITGKGGVVYRHRTGFCLEPQHYPDSPNKTGFPPVTLRPGEHYHNTIIYRFAAMAGDCAPTHPK